MKIESLGLINTNGYSVRGCNVGQAGHRSCNFALQGDTCNFTGKTPSQKAEDTETAWGRAYSGIKKAVSEYFEGEPLENSKYKYKLSEEELKSAASLLAEPQTPEYEAIMGLARENFICIKDKNSAFKIFQNYHKSLPIEPDSKIFVLDPQEPAKKKKKIGTSNEYMCKWYMRANRLNEKESAVDVETLENMVSKSRDYDNITIIVPDDCSITGRSLVVKTAMCLNRLDFPQDKNITIAFAPLVGSPCAEKVFNSVSNFDMEALKKTGSLGIRDYEITENFLKKYKNAKIVTPNDIIEARPFDDTPYFTELKKSDPDLARSVYSIMSYDGKRMGYGRPNVSGLMVAVPSGSGGLKCPNNNAYGATPFALAAGAKPENIKRPNRNVSVKGWQKELIDMLVEI